MKLGQVFDPRRNALNAWRLLMASAVVLQHCWPLTGHTAPALGGLYDVAVDGFFVLSGFLITASWLRNPHPREYFVARALRIFPGLWVCLIVVAFVIAPIGVAIQGGSPKKLLMSTAPIEYVLNNAVLNVYHGSIAGTPNGVPWPHVWNGTLWTLIFELFCYIGVAAAGLMGLLDRRWAVPVAFLLAVSLSAVVSYPAFAVQTIPQMIGRFAVAFLAGMLIHQFRDVLPARWSLVALCMAIVVASALLMVNYRIVAAIPLAYAVIVSGSLIHNPRLRLRTDLSYGVYIYGWPVQQLLVICGLKFLNPFVFAVVAGAATIPLAAGSWFLVEKRAMALKVRFTQKKLGLPAVTVQQEAASG
ncbi:MULTISPECIES: acyltransferase family protein [Mycobacterium avium complex (MAC)]|uniref:Acyltransferase n=1 Tax=Mycobacterium timonense TaxID=701043 RepID=A0ABX3TFB8_9MYCO|nr:MULTISPECIES: acyltransferase [Mycobacterium avium complex (MAC)]MBZ4581517.1 acyltransferase [Mycobacterium avium subsp. hominissuis]MDV3249585.1 acyltransferase [Mycobacterium avium subsp. hominissuis]MDV3276657.1 acyltransferase [Mycobacterium avium subsp. hominissuis]MDV3324211.1 acyltransferase [Mycobacterium avium subsp. hominissuis]ORB77491.1 acyltransferase [Mycobacterium timonense]